MVVTSRSGERTCETHGDALSRALRRLESAGLDGLIRHLPDPLLLIERDRLPVRTHGVRIDRAIRADDQLVRGEVAAATRGARWQPERAGSAREQSRWDIDVSHV